MEAGPVPEPNAETEVPAQEPETDEGETGKEREKLEWRRRVTIGSQPGKKSRVATERRRQRHLGVGRWGRGRGAGRRTRTPSVLRWTECSRDEKVGAAVGSNMGETVLSEAVGEVVADWVDDVYELNGRSQCADAWMTLWTTRWMTCMN